MDYFQLPLHQVQSMVSSSVLLGSNEKELLLSKFDTKNPPRIILSFNGDLIDGNSLFTGLQTITMKKNRTKARGMLLEVCNSTLTTYDTDLELGFKTVNKGSYNNTNKHPSRFLLGLKYVLVEEKILKKCIAKSSVVVT